jgi:uncharacterized membrane protein
MLGGKVGPEAFEMAAFRVPRYEWLTAVAAGGPALACAGVFVVLKRNEPEMPRGVTLSFTLLYGLLLGAALLVVGKVRRLDNPRQGVLGSYLTVGIVLLVGVGVPFVGRVRTLLG